MLSKTFAARLRQAPVQKAVPGAGRPVRAGAGVIALLLLLALVADVHDGDTIRLQDGSRVRLWGVDAPELKQAGGHEAQAFLAQLVQGREVQLEPHGTDRYGRQLAVVRVGGRSANEALLAAGWAWWYRKYTPEEKAYVHARGEGLRGAGGPGARPALGAMGRPAHPALGVPAPSSVTCITEPGRPPVVT